MIEVVNIRTHQGPPAVYIGRWMPGRQRSPLGNPYKISPEALFNLALLYEKGEGVAPDLRKAFSFYKRAAEIGDAPAQCNLGVAYLEGLGTRQNLTEGIKWIRKAAFQGDAIAQYILGMAYCDGEGVRKNIRYAQIWLGKAAQQGHKKASAKLLKIIRTK